MATTKIADLAIKVGEYEKDGKTKGEYENIGALMEGDDGNEFLLINNSALNPSLAMIANRDRKRRVLVSIFRDKEDQGGGKTQQSKPAAGGGGRDDDGIPFAPVSRRTHF